MLFSESQPERHKLYSREASQPNETTPLPINPFALIQMSIRSALVPMHHTTTSSLIYDATYTYSRNDTTQSMLHRWYMLLRSHFFFFYAGWNTSNGYSWVWDSLGDTLVHLFVYIRCDKGWLWGWWLDGLPRYSKQPATK